jgi:hypothetical protein
MLFKVSFYIKQILTILVLSLVNNRVKYLFKKDPFRDLMKALKQEVNLKFDKIYYNDSIESNIKEYEEKPIDKDLG